MKLKTNIIIKILQIFGKDSNEKKIKRKINYFFN
jgi:hypothetical protein